MLPLILRFVAIALGLLVAQWSADSVEFASPASFVFSVVLLGIFSTILKPVLILLMLPLVVLTLGAGLWVINALLVMFTSALVPGFVLGGWGAAFWVALWVSLFALGGFLLTGQEDQRFRQVVVRKRGFRTEPSRKNRADDDVIDI